MPSALSHNVMDTRSANMCLPSAVSTAKEDIKELARDVIAVRLPWTTLWRSCEAWMGVCGRVEEGRFHLYDD